MSICFSQAPLPSLAGANVERNGRRDRFRRPWQLSFAWPSSLAVKLDHIFRRMLLLPGSRETRPLRHWAHSSLCGAPRPPVLVLPALCRRATRSGGVRPELLVVVHGSPRTFMEFRDHFQDFGEDRNTLVLCPLFPVGVNGDGNADSYSLLQRTGHPLRRHPFGHGRRGEGALGPLVRPVRAVRLLGRRAVRQSLPAAPAAIAVGLLDRRARFGDAFR